MLFILFLLVLLFLNFLPIKRNHIIFVVLYLGFTILLSLRYGQGTDYFNYLRIYNAFPKDYNNFWVKSYSFGVEPFFYLINIFAKKNDYSFQFVIALCSMLTMFFNFISIKKFSKSFGLSMFILYANYIVYLHTAIRQGIAISISTYAILSFLNSKKYLKYLFTILFAMMFHTSAFICLFLPLILIVSKILNINSLKNYIFVISLCLITGIFLFPILIKVASLILPRYSSYVNSKITHVPFFPILIRIVLSILAIITYKNNEYNSSFLEKDILSLYLFGSMIYCLLCSSNQASRLTDYFTYLEIFYFANVISVRGIKMKGLSILSICFIFSSLFIKDIGEFENQGDYYSNNPLNYPYISIFNKDSIKEYRGDLGAYIF